MIAVESLRSPTVDRMSVFLSKGEQFIGVPLMKIRDLLAYWERSGERTGWRYGKLRGVKLSPFTVAVLIEELRDRGLIGLGVDMYGRPQEDGLTERGKALASAKAALRTPKAEAFKVLEGMLEAADGINARPGLPFSIARIWLFGSMIDPEKPDVGDIDFHVEYGAPSAEADPEILIGQHFELAAELDPPSGLGNFAVFDWVRERLLFGARKHRLLAPADKDELVDLGCECRLIFDAARGGRVDDAVLPRHPASEGPRSDLPPRRTMPDLKPGEAAIAPIDVKLLVPRLLYQDDFQTGFPSKTNPEKASAAYLAHRGRMPMVVCAPPSAEAPVPSGTSAALDLAKCDGRSLFAVLLEIPQVPFDPDLKVGCTVLLGRTIVPPGSGKEHWTWRMTVEGYDDGGTFPTPEMLMMLRWVVHVCLQADIERMVRRGLEDGGFPPFKLEFEDKVDHPVVKLLLDVVEDDAEFVPDAVVSRIEALRDAASEEGEGAR